ncbi:PadR family transcriptional regulator [Priestia endophytica]
MRILKYAILGLLYNEKLTGYDITSEFKGPLGQFWTAKHSQIYPELRKLTDEGFIQYEVVVQGTKLEKKVYEITSHGEKELSEWLEKVERDSSVNKDEFMLKTYFISAMEKEEAYDLFNDQLVKRKEKLSKLQKTLSLLEEEGEMPITFSSPQFGHYLVLTRAIEREKGYIVWLEKTIDLLK